MNETHGKAPRGKAESGDQVLDHDFDGIREYDNRLPNWWLWIFWGAILFALVYWLVFHTIGVGKLPRERYALEMDAAAKAQLARAAKGGLSDQALELMAAMPDRVSEGKALFDQYCAVCHREQGQGLVGPNLTDAFWIHGGAPMDIHKVITDGVLSKGMAAWGRQLGPARVEAVTAYVLTLRDTNVPGKAPEGQPLAPALAGGAATGAAPGAAANTAAAAPARPAGG